MKITSVSIIPVAVPDVPLVNTKGVHGAVFLRAILELETDTGIIGISETYGAKRTLAGLRMVANSLIGLDPYNLRDLRNRVSAAIPNGGGINAPTALTDHQLIDVVYSAMEIACLDIQGKAVGRPLVDLLGGQVRSKVSFGAYLFYKFEKPADQVGQDMFGKVMCPESLAAQARSLVDAYGFKSLKLKGGVLPPDLEIETMLLLRDKFPDFALRIDPMGAWTVPTAKRVADALYGTLEYLEDPVRGMDAMADLSAQIATPLATNLVVVEFEQIFEALRKNAVQIILSDHHYWRGATGAIHLSEICRAAKLGVSMHSNSHLGVSLAAMCHVAAASPNLTYDCDSHYPLYRHEVIKGGRMPFKDGKVKVPTGPGLGVDLDPDAVAELHEIYNREMVRDRDDTDDMLKYVPDYIRKVPRW